MWRMFRVLFVVGKILRRGQAALISASIALCMMLLPAAPAIANQSPVSCNSNRLNTSIIKDKTEVARGDTITYTVTVTNANSGSDLACDITNATIQLTLPAADGTATGTIITLASGVDYLAGTPVTVVGSAPYVVNVDPGVTDIVAQVSANGTLHDAPTNHSASITKTLGTSVITIPAASSPSSSSSGSDGQSAAATATVPKLPNTGSL